MRDPAVGLKASVLPETIIAIRRTTLVCSSPPRTMEHNVRKWKSFGRVTERPCAECQPRRRKPRRHPALEGLRRTAPSWMLAAALAPLALPAHGGAAALQTEDAGRIWARVTTAAGDVHAGFIRWNRSKVAWTDILEGVKELPEENYFAWLEANDRERAVGTLEVGGYRVTWNESDPDFPMEVQSGVRFGQLDSLVYLGEERAAVVLRSGRRIELSAPGSGLRSGFGDVTADVPGTSEIEMEWGELDRIVFLPAPAGALPSGQRLFGTVEDREGNRFTGHIAWDLDEVLDSDILDGEETRLGNDREFRFEHIRSLTRTPMGARVAHADGITELRGSNDVSRGNRGVQITVPELGIVVVPWEQIDAVHFYEADEGLGAPEPFDGGRPLEGSVITQDGEKIEGRLRWDADEAEDWEILDGRAEGAEYRIEFGRVRGIAPNDTGGATVTLNSGRVLELGATRDLSPENKGLLVASDAEDGEGRIRWRLVQWDDIREVRLQQNSGDPGFRRHR